VRLKAILRTSVAAACIAAIAVPAAGQAPKAAAAPPPPARSPVEVRVAQAKGFSRIEFQFVGQARAASRREGQVLTVRFNRAVKPDIAQLKVFPPQFLKTAEAQVVGGALEVRFTLADGADAAVGQADGAIYVNLFAAKPKPEAPPVKTADPGKPAKPALAGAPTPVPNGTVVHVVEEIEPGRTTLTFPWKVPLAAAVFRRGEAVWVVFDAKAGLDVSKVSKTGQLTGAQVVQGRDFSALRLVVPANTPVTATGQGVNWYVVLGAAPTEKPTPVQVRRDPESSVPALSAAMAGATRAIRIDDPVVGDQIIAVPALAPAKGSAVRREFVELALLPSLHGLAIEPYAEDLTVSASGDLVHIGRPSGMALSPLGSQALAATGPNDAPKAASMPALIDFASWSALHGKGYYDRYDALMQAASAEAAAAQPLKGQTPKVEARMALARFLIGSKLSFEAIGVLNLLAKSHPSVTSNNEFMGLRGAAKVMSRRYAEAQVDLGSAALAGEPSSALWRGYVAAQLGEYTEARRAFSIGYQALGLFDPDWRARFAAADADAALALGDLSVARTQITAAINANPSPDEMAKVRLVQAKLFEAEGQRPRALAVYDELSKVSLGLVASPAILRATQIRLDDKAITPIQAAKVFDGLRYRWRGDSTELEAIQRLGKLYLDLGRYREALEAWRSAGQRLPDLPLAVQLQADQFAAFRYLFLDGGADGLQPIEAVALFYDFGQELTPVGADGDLMVRRLAKRLVDVDLLDQAAGLLKYQMEQRLDGVPKAQVATDLALIYLMDRKPEQALVAINSSRTTILPTPMNNERRIITARALTALGRFDQALEFLETDKSADGADVRAEIAWKQRDWKIAAPIFEKQLGDRFKQPGPLSPVEEARLLRASVAYSLAGDEVGLTRLSERFGGFLEQSRSPEALKIALSGMDAAQISSADFARAIADNDTFTAWVAGAKKRFRERPSPTGGVPVKRAEAVPPPAAKPAAKG